jgi:hypothetical protein
LLPSIVVTTPSTLYVPRGTRTVAWPWAFRSGVATNFDESSTLPIWIVAPRLGLPNRSSAVTDRLYDSASLFSPSGSETRMPPAPVPTR